MSLDLHDIQGNIVKAYPRLGYPMARYVFFRIRHATSGRNFVKALIPRVTNAAPWDRTGAPRPIVTMIRRLRFRCSRWAPCTRPPGP